MTKAKKFRPGTVFHVPLRSSGCGTGVVVATNDEGVMYGYFFGPVIHGEGSVEPAELEPEDAVLVGQFGDLGLIKGEWPVIGLLEPLDRNKWCMYPLARIDEISNTALLSTYNERLQFTGEKEIPLEEADKYPYDRLMGSGSVEIRLTKLLAEHDQSTRG